MSEYVGITGEQAETLRNVLAMIDKGECDTAFEILFNFLTEETEVSE